MLAREHKRTAEVSAELLLCAPTTHDERVSLATHRHRDGGDWPIEELDADVALQLGKFVENLSVARHARVPIPKPVCPMREKRSLLNKTTRCDMAQFACTAISLVSASLTTASIVFSSIGTPSAN